jgi:hypothetical protein
MEPRWNEHTSKNGRDDQSELAIELLRDFTFMTFKALLDVAGPIRTRELCRGYFKNHGEAGALNMQRRLGAPSDLPGAFQMGKLVLLWQRRDFVKDVRPDIIHWQNTTCLFENAPPEFCLLFENVATPAANHAICPDYQYVCDKMVTQGDPVCSGRGFVRPGSPYHGRLDEIPELGLPNIPEEEVDFWTLQVLGEEWVMCTKAILDHEYPDLALDLLMLRLKEYGRTMGSVLASKFGVTGRDAMAIGSLFDSINVMLQQFGLAISSNPQMVEKELSECPFRNATKEMCMMFEAFGNGICEEINPEFEIVHTEAMCAGDATCRRIIRRKALTISKGKRSDDIPIKTSATTEADLLMALKMRLAKGEITSQEYDRLRERLISS